MIRFNRCALQRSSFWRQGSPWLILVLATALVGACSSNSTNPDGGGQCTTMGALGPADDHCSGPDGGTMVTTVDPTVCGQTADAGDDGGAASQGCPYASTMFGQQGDDDDCKYHVSWSSTPICKGSTATLTVVATNLGSGTPLAGALMQVEAFTTTPGDQDSDTYCDSNSPHGTPTDRGMFIPFSEHPQGTYAGSLVFDQSGAWTVRFHFFETCFDAPNSPHGHAAFHITVP